MGEQVDIGQKLTFAEGFCKLSFPGQVFPFFGWDLLFGFLGVGGRGGVYSSILLNIVLYSQILNSNANKKRGDIPLSE